MRVREARGTPQAEAELIEKKPGEAEHNPKTFTSGFHATSPNLYNPNS